MFTITIHVFQMDINCILMKYYLMCMIVILVFQKYCICILINETLFSNQIKSNHFYCHITTAQVPW